MFMRGPRSTFRSFLRKQKKSVQRLEFSDIQEKKVSHPYSAANRKCKRWSQSAAILNLPILTRRPLFPIRSTGDITFDSREDDWERGWVYFKIILPNAPVTPNNAAFQTVSTVSGFQIFKTSLYLLHCPNNFSQDCRSLNYKGSSRLELLPLIFLC